VQTLNLIPLWKVFSGHPIFGLPRYSQRIALIGATADEAESARARLPSTTVLPISAQDSIEAIVAKLPAPDAVDHIIWMAPNDGVDHQKPEVGDALITSQQSGVLSCFRLMKALMQAGYVSRPLVITAVTRSAQAIHDFDPLYPEHAGVHGLMGAVAKEHASWKVRMLDVEAGQPCPLSAVLSVPADPTGDVWAYRKGTWYRRELAPYEPVKEVRATYRKNGVYIVIGGAGGIGEVWTEHVIRHAQAQVIWIGRREINAEIRAKQSRLAQSGPEPAYIQADAQDRSALQSACDQIRQRHGAIHGIVHAAIVLQDCSVAQMTEQRFEAALRAKVDVSVRMIQVFGAEPLDFIVFFSSLMSFGKAPGQSNYAAGCAFKDAFSQWLARSRPGIVKTMNWGYWGSVGVVASETYRARMANVGLGSIEAGEGMRALDTLLAGPFQQMAFLKATWAAAKQTLRLAADESILCNYARAPVLISPRLSPRPVPPEILEAASGAMQVELDRILCGLLREQLRALGLLAGRGGNLAPQYERWMDESLRVLAAHQEISNAWDEWARYRQAHQSDAGLTARLDLVDRMLRGLGDVLSGRRWAVELLFPKGAIGSMEQTYKNSPEVDYFNAVLADSLTEYLDARLLQDDDARIRILEVGAGTGTTTAVALARLHPYQEHVREYCYTDVSQTFLRHGEQRYADEHPYLRFHLFDVERAPGDQSMEVGGYDVVIAANVIHATKDIRRTLQNAKAVLARNGVLLLNEVVSNSLIAHLTFGLTPGWWLAADSSLRLQGSPGIPRHTWLRVLQEEGFRAVGFPALAAEHTGMQIITAQSDGVVRQSQGGPSALKQAAHN
jgi:NAD(P)-dependent dehydrogenase (short-subunit alcohol dehydrogenase family)/SAM-dependent methyltransferase